MAQLSGRETRALREALSDAFRTRAQLKRMLHERMDLPLEEIAGAGGLREVIGDVLQEVDSTNRIAELLESASADNPGNPLLRAFIAKYRRSPQRAMTGEVLEKIVKPNLTYKNAAQWREELERLERRVCRIEVDGQALGTGFLVAPDLVLTNYHVVEAAIAAGNAATYAARFDYQLGVDALPEAGKLVPFHAVWDVEHSQYHPSDLLPLPKNPEPDKEHLDYAVIRLAEAVGNEIVDEGNAIKRGHVNVFGPAGALAVDDPLFILQHPAGAPLKLALDTRSILETNPEGTRVRYVTNTDPGSSGSPCFDADWNLVVLHHSGDPAKRIAPSHNEGIPIRAIREALSPETAKLLGAPT